MRGSRGVGADTGHRIPWRFIAVSTLVLANAGLSAQILHLLISDPHFRAQQINWHVLTDAGRQIASGNDPYAGETSATSFRYSPLVAWMFAAMEPIGAWGFNAFALALVGLLPGWLAASLVLTSWPLWEDIASGASFLFLPIAGLLAIRGSRGGAVATSVLAVLMPRPMVIPILAWMWLRSPELRATLALMVLATLSASFAVGWGPEWIRAVLDVAGTPTRAWFSPLAVLGPLWPLLVVAAAWSTWKGHVGLAALAISPYWTPAYPLILLLELRTLPAQGSPWWNLARWVHARAAKVACR